MKNSVLHKSGALFLFIVTKWKKTIDFLNTKMYNVFSGIHKVR